MKLFYLPYTATKIMFLHFCISLIPCYNAASELTLTSCMELIVAVTSTKPAQ